MSSLPERAVRKSAFASRLSPAAVTTTLPGAIGTLEEAEIRFARAYVSLELASAEEALADEALLNAEAKLLSATPAERPALQTTVVATGGASAPCETRREPRK